MLSSRACLVREESRNGEGELLGYVVSVGRGRVCLEHSDDAGSRARQPRARNDKMGRRTLFIELGFTNYPRAVSFGLVTPADTL